jgi:integrase
MHNERLPKLEDPRQTPWNKGKLIGSKPPLRTKDVWSIRTKLQVEKRIRDLAMFNLAIDSKLRGCDVVSLKVEDVAPHGMTVDRATVRQRKTGHPVRFELSEQTREAVDDYIRSAPRRAGEFLFPSRRHTDRCLTTRQYSRLVSAWIAGIDLDPALYGTHSLRRTKATLIYRRTGNLRAVQLLSGHRRIDYVPRRTMSRCGRFEMICCALVFNALDIAILLVGHFRPRGGRHGTNV